jgi:hypothetical protein
VCCRVTWTGLCDIWSDGFCEIRQFGGKDGRKNSVNWIYLFRLSQDRDKRGAGVKEVMQLWGAGVK